MSLRKTMQKNLNRMAALVTLASAYWSAQQWHRTWGATDAEVAADLPGDGLVPNAKYAATRAITIETPPGEVWPWLLQLGQNRGGFYSYDFLENLIGLNIHSTDEIRAEWQRLAVGDPIALAEGLELEVRVLDPGHALVLGSGADAQAPGPIDFDFSWAFVLQPQASGDTRLVVRERYGWVEVLAAPMIHAVGWASMLMSQKMLRTIKELAEHSGAGPVTPASAAESSGVDSVGEAVR